MRHLRLTALVLVLMLAAYLYGNATLRTDGKDWCVHFDGFMVCNQSSTDYVLGVHDGGGK